MNVQKDLMADDARSATQNIRLYYILLLVPRLMITGPDRTLDYIMLD